MELGAAGLKEQPFRIHGRPVVFVNYAGQERALEFLRHTYKLSAGLGLLQGPTLAGKTTIIRHFAQLQSEHCAVAVTDGAGINTTAFLESVLREFGYEHKFDTINELVSMLKVFAQQQMATGRPPLLIVENIHEMNPSALRVLCELAEVRVRRKFALRMILVSDRHINYIVNAPAMDCMSKRLTGDFHLAPLTIDETSRYLYTKMRQGGCIDPDRVIPQKVCDELYRASGGWPGAIDRLALLALAKTRKLPIKPKSIEHPVIAESTRDEAVPNGNSATEMRVSDVPELCLTHNGKTLKEVAFDGSRLLIGRSEHNDIAVDSKFISRHHALLVRHGSATLVMDLNSANGTFVNSRRVSNQVLVHDDVITLGDHGLKFIDSNARRRIPIESINLDDTVVMKTLDDMRRVLTRENTEILPVQTSGPESGGGSA